jgi:hypothetical protein
MSFPAIWALNYELQFDFKKEKPWKLCHISEFDFLQPPCTHVDQGQQGCAPLCTPYKSTPVVTYSKASVTFSQFACQLFDRF